MLQGEAELVFNQLCQDYDDYLQYSHHAGPHTFHGIYYRRMASEREGQVVELIDEIISRGSNNGRFEHLYLRYKGSIKYPIRKMDLIVKLVEMGEITSDGIGTFEDKIVSGYQILGKNVGL